MESVKDKAKKANGRVHCTKCKFWINGLCIDPRVAEVCSEQFVKGYIKGYNQRKSEERK